jgi:propanol-preferring alcohol dehydrogenase
VKACVLKSAAPVDERPLHVTEINTPSPGPDEVLVRVRACGVCRTDLHVVEGDLPERHAHVVPGHQAVGEVAQLGENVSELSTGERVGIAWLRRTCGECRFCRSQRENLCERAEFNGWTANGGFAEHVAAPAAFVYRLPRGFDDLQAAPLLCAGIIGYRSLRLTGICKERWNGARVGLYGFGAAGHVVIQVARSRGAEVYVCTRDRETHQRLASELGAVWVGDATEPPPVKLDASIVFAPAGELVPPALEGLDKGGVLVLGGIHMSPIPSFDYSLLYHERVIRSVANNTRDDGREFLEEAARIPVRTHVQSFRLNEVNEALIALKHDAIKGAAVLTV